MARYLDYSFKLYRPYGEDATLGIGDQLTASLTVLVEADMLGS